MSGASNIRVEIGLVISTRDDAQPESPKARP
jgi:hypothetical protein